MNRSTVIFLCLVAGLAAAGAIVANGNMGFAIPAAAVAVGAAAILLASVLERTLWPLSGPRPSSTAASTRVRTAFERGPLGRLEILALLDSLDADAGGPARPGPSARELELIQAAKPEEFRRYLDSRLRELERRT